MINISFFLYLFIYCSSGALLIMQNVKGNKEQKKNIWVISIPKYTINLNIKFIELQLFAQIYII